MSVGAGDLADLIAAIDACHDPEDLVSAAGPILARRTRLRELWFFDAVSGVLHARASGLLPLEERPLTQLDTGTAALVRAARHARQLVQIEGEVSGAANEALKVSLLAVPLRRADASIGFLGLLTAEPGGIPSALAPALARVAGPLASAAERVALRAEVRRLEAELGRAQSLSALGRLSAAVAHEIRNPLAAMTHAITLLHANPGLDTEDHSLLEILLEEVARVNRIVTDFLAFSKPSAGRFAPARIGELVEGVAQLLRRDPCVGSVALTLAIAPDLPDVRLDADKIRQALWNLCLNAAQAISRGGRITVSARAQAEGSREGVRLEVCDDGPGIAPELRERAFQPFETTRANGTGLGLALARHSIALHDGWIRIEDAAGGGACVRFWLPVDGPDALRDAADED